MTPIQIMSYVAGGLSISVVTDWLHIKWHIPFFPACLLAAILVFAVGLVIGLSAIERYRQ